MKNKGGLKMRIQIYDPWQTAAEVIGNKLCLTPERVKRVLFKLGSKPGVAYIKAIEMAELDLEKFLEMVLEER